ncbi:transposase [Catenovulum adriaticum]|uniref:Transposase n=1 Tax=Catenovulum adriaticum TaxID=2984846 RepID=A0ABY7ARJ7_9ALTE|nr:transposase [Catenovulum sp. TS8]WAJ71940.1 transposase [Catenovulum sp. TS8]
MANYKPNDSHQNQFIAVDFSAQIIPGTFEYALSHIVDNHLDLSSFDARYNNDNGGATAYSPAIMLKIILFAYSRGYISSRKIAQACQTNITFIALSGDAQPHFTSIASFVTNMSEHIEPLFTKVLLICQQQNLIGHQMFAIDGCKISSNASKEWSGTHQELKQKAERLKLASKRIIAAHKAQDECPDTEIAKDLKQKEKLDNTAKKIAQFLADKSERIGNRNTPVKSHKLFTYDEFKFDAENLTCICPAGNTMWLTAKPKADATHTRFQAYLKDCRDCPMRAQCMQKEPKNHVRQVSIPIAKQRTAAQILSDKMKAKIDSPQGRREYSKRLGCIEPVFANITKNKGMDYFTLRGKTKVNAQWQMYCLVHNIEKLRNTSEMIQ